MKGRRGQEQWRHGDVGGEPWVLGGSTIEEIRQSRYFYVGIRSRSRTKLSGSNGCHTSGRLGPEWDDFLLKILLFGVVYL